MNVTMIERNCADCLLRAMENARERETVVGALKAEPEDALEMQIERLEWSFGPDWKW